ncbi:unnamed protein product [Rotaria socialis]|uniref:Uncharacterized protein n=1 Tax=Rotaria socialis TaxID=392032 RepID=A0A818DYG3_9BILA|nr:unnamed protein product [Rotaria socialis]
MVWKRFHSVSGQKDKQHFRLIINDLPILTSEEKARKFGHHFHALFHLATIPRLLKTESDLILYSYNMEIPSLERNFTAQELNTVVQNLPSKKASGYDFIPYEFIKNPSDIVKAVLLKTFNKCLRDGIFPKPLKSYYWDNWKDACTISLSSFLKNRTFQSFVSGFYSEVHNITTGVPQGSILSPLLFIIILSTIISLDLVKITMFADDIALYICAPNMELAQRQMQAALDKLSKWATEWGFVLNPQKCSFQYFTRKVKFAKPTLKLNNRPLTLVYEQRYLGLIFDSPLLTWDAHIKYLVENCSKRVNVLRALTSTTWGGQRQTLHYCGPEFPIQRYPLPLISPQIPVQYPHMVHTDLILPVNKSNSSQLLCQTFLTTMEIRFPDTTQVFTDGSKRDEPQPSVSAAIYIPSLDCHEKWKLPTEFSILSAELFGILKALTFIRERVPGEYTICVDSMSALHYISKVSPKHYNELYYCIIKQLSYLWDAGFQVSFQWTPAHCGIIQNEKVDKFAGDTHSLAEITQFPTPIKDQIRKVKYLLKEEMASQWNILKDHLHLGVIKKIGNIGHGHH